MNCVSPALGADAQLSPLVSELSGFKGTCQGQDARALPVVRTWSVEGAQRLPPEPVGRAGSPARSCCYAVLSAHVRAPPPQHLAVASCLVSSLFVGQFVR